MIRWKSSCTQPSTTSKRSLESNALSAIRDSAATAPQLLALIDKGAKESKTKENLGRLWPQECSDSRKVNLALHKDGTTAMGESMVRYL
jgi:hypothetical protein